jgi:hypothetical protein
MIIFGFVQTKYRSSKNYLEEKVKWWCKLGAWVPDPKLSVQMSSESKTFQKSRLARIDRHAELILAFELISKTIKKRMK